jgi:hypothetical protein
MQVRKEQTRQNRRYIKPLRQISLIVDSQLQRARTLQLGPHGPYTSRDLYSARIVSIHHDDNAFLCIPARQQDYLLAVLNTDIVCELHNDKVNWSVANHNHGRMPCPCTICHSLATTGYKGTEVLEVWEAGALGSCRGVEFGEV